MSENGRLIASSSSTILQKMQRSGGILSYGPEISMEKKKKVRWNIMQSAGT